MNRLQNTLANIPEFADDKDGKNCYTILQVIAKDKKCVVELGTRFGYSIETISQAKNVGKLYTYDHVESPIAKEICQKIGAKYIIADTRTANYDGELIDLLYIDTLHSAKQLVVEFNNFQKHLSPNAVVIVDDIFLNDKARGFQSIPGDKIVLGSPYRDPGFGIIVSDEKGWRQSTLVASESLPPVVSKLYEIWARIRGMK